MKPLEELVRPCIRALKPYSTARDEYAGGEISVWLDANESPFDNGINRYPDPHQRQLKRQVAAMKGVREEQVFLGNGSDEAIDLAYRIFCTPGRDNAVAISPTYGMYRVAADMNDIELREVPLGRDFSLPVEALLGAGAAIDARNGVGETPLLVAARAGNNEVVRLLVERHADVNAADNLQHTALYYAGERGFNEIVEKLLENGAE